MDKKLADSLKQKADSLLKYHLTDFFLTNESRSKRYQVETEGLWLNYSRNHLDDEAVSLLLSLADRSDLKRKIACLFNGDKINQSESRSALHPLLRSPLLEGNHYSELIHKEMQKMHGLLDKIGRLDNDNQIRDIVCIGIGGSELGVKVVNQALSDHLKPKYRIHFVSNIDSAAVRSVIRKVDRKHTLFFLTSKTMTTLESVQNFKTLKQWFLSGSDHDSFMKSCYAITANPQKAKDMGFLDTHIFEFWDWVGGRFSLWSSVGLPIMLTYGEGVFKELLRGAYDMDNHFKSRPLSENMPVILGLIHVYYSNFLNYPSRAVIPYADKLDYLPSYLQQLEMESLGKSVDVYGNTLDYQTSPIVWGSAGSNGQHAFFQLLHQGSQVVPVDFIAALSLDDEYIEHHNALLANCLAQSESLMMGGDIGVREHGSFLGNRPSNLLILKDMTPYHLGQLLALYEHKVFVQSIIWNINAFDQWGVELGKRFANQLLEKQISNKNIDLEKIKSSFN